MLELHPRRHPPSFLGNQLAVAGLSFDDRRAAADSFTHSFFFLLLMKELGRGGGRVKRFSVVDNITIRSVGDSIPNEISKY